MLGQRWRWHQRRLDDLLRPVVGAPLLNLVLPDAGTDEPGPARIGTGPVDEIERAWIEASCPELTLVDINPALHQWEEGEERQAMYSFAPAPEG